MGKRFFRGVLIAATTGVGASLLAPMAAQAAVMCGQTITADTVLTADLTCPGTGIFVNASNVTLDLGGFTLSGPAPSSGTIRGISVSNNKTGVTVKNGTVRGFDIGVDLNAGANGGVVSGLTLDTNGLGVLVNSGASATRLTNNNILNTTRFSGIQMGGNGHLVEGNAFDGVNSVAIFFSGNDNVIRANRINESGSNGVLLSTFPTSLGPFLNNQIIDNTLSGSGRLFNANSISVNKGSGTLIQGNTVYGRRTTPGVFLLDSANTMVSRNTLANNSTGVLVRGASTGTQLLGNRADLNVFSGLAVESAATGTVVADNVVSRNGGNGLDLRNASATVSRNTAVSNGALGIFAVAGVTDGGGNKASGNGNPAQCSPGIAC